MTCLPLLFLCASPKNGDAHWRVMRPAVRLAEQSAAITVCWLGDAQMPTEPVAGRVVVLHQVVVDGGQDAATAWTDRLRAAGALAVVYDTDDDEWTGSHIDHQAATQPISTSDRAELERRCQARIDTLRAADGATVSTEPLAAVVRRYTDRPVIVVPNAIDVEWFRACLAPQPIDPEHLTIGWAGWRRPDADLEPMAIAWSRIAVRYPDVRFVVAGHQPDVIYRQDIPLDRIIRLPIAPLGSYPVLHQVDIGCCAVADSPFNRCKTPIKAWEYALAGAAVVYSPTLYGDCLTDWVDGYQAETPDEWEERLSRLVENPDLRRAMNDLLVSHVEAEHSLSSQVHRWQDAYSRIIGARERVTA